MSTDFNNLTDHFGIETANIVLISSNDGKTRNVTDVVHYGPIDAEEISSPVYNPVCVYEIVGDVSLSIVLGAMATSLDAFITSVSVTTRQGETPKLTVRGTANEGVRAINLFTFACSVSRRHRVQNLMGALSSITNATELTVTAKVDPVVLWEGGAPSASDVVKGQVALSVAHYGAAPTATAGSGWKETNAPKSERANDFNTRTATFIKALTVHH